MANIALYVYLTYYKPYPMPKPVSISPFDIEVLKVCKGYAPKFIDGKTAVSLNVLNDAHKKLLPKVDGNVAGLLNYTNLSVWYNKKRKVTAFSFSRTFPLRVLRIGNLRQLILISFFKFINYIILNTNKVVINKINNFSEI